MSGIELDEIHKFLARKGHAPLSDGELPIWLRHFLKGELGRNFEKCWQRDKLGTFYEDVFTPDEFRDIEQALVWLDELSK